MCHGSAPRRRVALGTGRRRLGARRSNTEAAPSIGRAADTPGRTGADRLSRIDRLRSDADQSPRPRHWRKAGPSLRSGFGLRCRTVLLKRRFGSLSRGNSCTSRRPNPERSDGPALRCGLSRIGRRVRNRIRLPDHGTVVRPAFLSGVSFRSLLVGLCGVLPLPRPPPDGRARGSNSASLPSCVPDARAFSRSQCPYTCSISNGAVGSTADL